MGGRRRRRRGGRRGRVSKRRGGYPDRGRTNNRTMYARHVSFSKLAINGDGHRASSSPYKRRDPPPIFLPSLPSSPLLSLRILRLFSPPILLPSSSRVSLSFLFFFPPFISLALPIPKHPGVNSRRIKFQEGRFRGEFMGLGYRSRFQPLARNRDWYLHPRIVPIPVSYSAPYACARFLRVLDTRAQPTTITGFCVTRACTCIINVIYSCTRDRQTQSHKRKQGLLGLPPVTEGVVRAGTYNRALNILHPSTSIGGV